MLDDSGRMRRGIGDCVAASLGSFERHALSRIIDWVGFVRSALVANRARPQAEPRRTRSTGWFSLTALLGGVSPMSSGLSEQRPVRRSHPPQPTKMRGHACSQRFVLHVFDPEVSTRLLHKSRDRWIIRVTDPWEQVVFDLKVQASKEPPNNSALPGEVHGRLDLMDCPRVFDAPSAVSRHWEGRLFHAVGKLKHDTQHGTKHERGHQVVEQYDARAVKQQRNAERRGQEDRFTDQENDQVPLFGRGTRCSPIRPVISFRKSSRSCHLIASNPYSGQR